MTSHTCHGKDGEIQHLMTGGGGPYLVYIPLLVARPGGSPTLWLGGGPVVATGGGVPHFLARGQCPPACGQRGSSRLCGKRDPPPPLWVSWWVGGWVDMCVGGYVGGWAGSRDANSCLAMLGVEGGTKGAANYDQYLVKTISGSRGGVSKLYCEGRTAKGGQCDSSCGAQGEAT